MKAVPFHTDKNILVLWRTEVSTCQKNGLFLVQTLTCFGLVRTWALWIFCKALGARHGLNPALVNLNLHLPPFRFSDKTLTVADMIRPQHQKWELNTHGHLNFRWYTPPDCYSGSPHQRKKTIFPKISAKFRVDLVGLHKKYALWFTSPFPAPSALAQMHSPRHTESPAPRADLAPASWDCPSSSSAATLLDWRQGTVHRAGKRKLSYKYGMGHYRTLRHTVRKCENLYASSTELSCHKSSNMSLSSCFLCQPQKQTKNFQTLQTAQLSCISLPEVLMVQEAVSFSRRCSQCLHSGTASSIIKTQWEKMKEGQKESLSLAWRNKGTLPCCTWNSFTPTAEQKLSELCQELQETYRRGCIGQC